jgi:hypothetical protein
MPDPTGVLTGITSAAAIAAGLNQASNLSDYGSNLKGELNALGNQLAENSAFKGYGVTSGLGSTSVGSDGSVNLGVGQNAGMNGYATQQMANSQTMFNRAMEDPAARQQDIYNQIMAAQNPQLNAMQAQSQARAQAMGRGGVRGSQFGGTAEDAAMARARADASNQAAMSAMQQADSERGMFGQMAANYGQNANQNRNVMGQLGSQMGQLGLGQNKAAYLPMQMQMELLNQSQGTGAMAQTGQLTGQDYLAQMLLGGKNANVNANKVSSELMGNLYDSILDNLGGESGADGSGSTGLFGAFEDIGNILGWGG